MSDLNDPRVLFAAERTLLAWNRTSLALLAFGFVMERSGLFMHVLLQDGNDSTLGRNFTFWIGLMFVVLGVFASVAAVIQHRAVLRTLRPVEIPTGYHVKLGMFINLVVAFVGALLTAFLLLRGPGFG